MFREKATFSLSWFSLESSILVELEFGKFGFSRGLKTGVLGKTLRAKQELNNKLIPDMAQQWNWCECRNLHVLYNKLMGILYEMVT